MSKRTPYDTGKRSEPRPWTAPHRESDDDYGKVDFEDDAGGTIATLYIEQEDDRSYTLKGYTNEPLRVEIEQEDPEEPQVYWDQEPDDERAEALATGHEHQPFGVDTARIIDLQAGGVIAYCHKDNADRLVRAIWAKEGTVSDQVTTNEGIEPVETIHWFPGDLVEWAHNDAYGTKVSDYGVVSGVERVLGQTTLWVYVPGHSKPRQWPAAQCRLLRRNNPNKEGRG
jgi:hypothetical protein